MEEGRFAHPKPPGLRTGFAERRKYPRFNCEFPIDCITSDSETHVGIAANISKGGMLVFLHERIDLGSPLRVNLIFTKGFQLKIVRANAVVVWCKVVRHAFWGRYRYGIRLIELEERFFSDFIALLGQLGRQFHFKNLFPSS
jgi:c-di-GMP-binding flagellar brake protein YcgR